MREKTRKKQRKDTQMREKTRDKTKKIIKTLREEKTKAKAKSCNYLLNSASKS